MADGGALREATVGLLHAEVAAMNVNNFVVRPKRRLVERYARRPEWETLDAAARGELAHEVAGLPAELDAEEQEAKRYLTIHKLRTNRPLTSSDLGELEQMLLVNGVGDEATLRQARDESAGLGLFVRSLIGLDREAAKKAFGSFLDDKTFTASQIEFVDLTVNYLTEEGVMSPSLLYESPFTDLAPTGPDGLFDAKQVERLLTVLNEVEAAARGTA